LKWKTVARGNTVTAKRRKGLLSQWIGIAPEYEGEFNSWYNTEHLHERLNAAGFLTARRYESVRGEPKYFAFYELEHVGVLNEEPYLQVRNNPTSRTKKMESVFDPFIRNVYEEIFAYGERPAEAAPHVFAVRTDIPADLEDEFNAWYNEEHIPDNVGIPGVYCACRYVALEGAPKYLTVYELENPDVPNTEAWARAKVSGRSPEILPNLVNHQVNLGKLLLGLTK
jgi:hypothetical protein